MTRAYRRHARLRPCGPGEATAKGENEVRTSWEVRCGKRLVALTAAHTAREAVIEYLRSQGCPDSEMTSVASDALTWGGAVYRAVPLGNG